MFSNAWKMLPTSLLCLTFTIGASLAYAQSESQQVQPVAPNGPMTVQPLSQAADSTGQGQPAEASEMPQEVQIGAGDLLEIRVFGVQDLTQQTRVSVGGDITMALVGSVHVAGLTQPQAEALIAAKFREGGFLRDPHVSVFTKEYATQGVSVLGEVFKPGVYALLGPRRLFDVVSMAGGLTARAGRLVTITHRDSPSKPVTVEFSNDAQSAANNPAIAPGDTIFISKAGVVYVVGDVAHPAGFVMENNERMTVLQAVALAGGTNGTASLDSTKIIRKNSSGIQEIPMPLKKILSAKADDVDLQPNDVLFIPRSGTKTAARRSAEAVLQVATGLAIYRR